MERRGWERALVHFIQNCGWTGPALPWYSSQGGFDKICESKYSIIIGISSISSEHCPAGSREHLGLVFAVLGKSFGFLWVDVDVGSQYRKAIPLIAPSQTTHHHPYLWYNQNVTFYIVFWAMEFYILVIWSFVFLYERFNSDGQISNNPPSTALISGDKRLANLILKMSCISIFIRFTFFYMKALPVFVCLKRILCKRETLSLWQQPVANGNIHETSTVAGLLFQSWFSEHFCTYMCFNLIWLFDDVYENINIQIFLETSIRHLWKCLMKCLPQGQKYHLRWR